MKKVYCADTFDFCLKCTPGIKMCTKLVSPQLTSYYPTVAINCADNCWFCVPFVFHGVSNFCSDILFKLQNINVGNWRSLLLRRDSGDSINHLNYHSSYAPTYLGHDFRCRWLSMTCILKFHGEFLLHWKHDNSVAYRICEISIFKLPHWTAKQGREEADVTEI